MKLPAQLSAAIVRALLPGVAASLLFAAAPAGAQIPAAAVGPAAATAVDIAKPIVVKVLKPKSSLAEFKGMVVNSTRAQITVRARDNEMVLRTFPLSPQLADVMQKVIDRGGYQYGDKVTVQYDATSGVAKRILGKPSKPV
jgi:hypothetical protein